MLMSLKQSENKTS